VVVVLPVVVVPVGRVIVVNVPRGPFAARTAALNRPASRQARAATTISTPRLMAPV
jgi:hypothetical protein